MVLNTREHLARWMSFLSLLAALGNLSDKLS